MLDYYPAFKSFVKVPGLKRNNFIWIQGKVLWSNLMFGLTGCSRKDASMFPALLPTSLEDQRVYYFIEQNFSQTHFERMHYYFSPTPLRRF